jgi:hypothetical protein
VGPSRKLLSSLSPGDHQSAVDIHQEPIPFQSTRDEMISSSSAPINPFSLHHAFLLIIERGWTSTPSGSANCGPPKTSRRGAYHVSMRLDHDLCPLSLILNRTLILSSISSITNSYFGLHLQLYLENKHSPRDAAISAVSAPSLDARIP